MINYLVRCQTIKGHQTPFFRTGRDLIPTNRARPRNSQKVGFVGEKEWDFTRCLTTPRQTKVLTRNFLILRNSSLARMDEGVPSLMQAGQAGRRPRHYYPDFIPARVPDGRYAEAEASVDLGMLCANCKNISSWVRTNMDTTKKGLDHQLRQYNNEKFYGRGSEVEASHESGCHLCSIIWHAMIDTLFSGDIAECANVQSRRENFQTAIRKATQISVYISGSDVSFQSQLADTIKTMFKLRVRFQLDGRSIELLGSSPGHNEKMVSPWEIPLAIPLPSPWSTVRQSEKSSTVARQESPYQTLSMSRVYTASSPSLALGRKWLDTCAKYHISCRTAPSLKKPKRLLKLTWTHVRVMESKDAADIESLDYAALSYSWGTESCFRLTSTTIRLLEVGVLTAQLPQTIRDAVYATLQLGLEWLWVDSLCIIQDSREDWEIEAAKMGDTYQGCSVCIAALGATCNSDGLFASRNPQLYAPCFLAMNARGESIYAYPWYIDLSEHPHPLHLRGWVLQERLLPSRTIGFGAYLTWNCREAAVNEFDLLGEEKRGTSELSAKFSNLCLVQPLTVPSTPGVTSESHQIRKLWRLMIQDYSHTKLTVKTDKLMAISGLIATIEKRTGWKNIYGLWVPFMLPNLLWMVSRTLTETARTGLRPSWSWIAVDGPVLFQLISDNAIPLADVVFEPESSGPARSMKSQLYVTLQVSCVPLTLMKVETSSYTLKELPSVLFFCKEDIHCTVGTRPRLFLPILNHLRSTYGLIVEPSSFQVGAYERVGIAETFCAKQGPLILLQDNTKRQTFLLI